MRESHENRPSRVMGDIMRPGDVAAALVLLTRLPLPRLSASTFRGARGAWAWPLAGLATGGLAALAATLGAGLGPGPAAGLALATAVIASGGLHEDGLADSCDGLWGGDSRARRLEIMHDSRIGSYGVLALVLSLLLRWSLLVTLFAGGWVWGPLLAVGMTSRAAMIAVMAALRPAREEGLSHAQGRPGATQVALGVGVAVLGGLLCVGWAALGVALAVALAAGGVALLARTKIGGQTGDILGATQQVAETAALMALVALI